MKHLPISCRYTLDHFFCFDESLAQQHDLRALREEFQSVGV